MYTTSSAFLKVLSNAGITHAFVNWGSDHPALLEDLQRQRVEGKETSPQIVTCPNEMVALSAAQGYAQVTGKPAAVIVHVDVGTQALAGAVHNVDRGRTPVLIYAGASASTSRSELKGTRNEWIMWIQDIPDQAAIVRQYMRYTAQISTGRNIDQVVNRALQIGTSDPQGPVYLWARRETMEEELPSSLFNSLTSSSAPPLPISPTGLSPATTSHLATTLTSSHHPLIITSNLGRNPAAITPLIALSDLTPPPSTETLNAFRKREAENLVQIARKLRELHNTSASAMQSRADQLEKHTHMFEEGFSQLDEIQQLLQLVSHQPIPAVPQEKLGHLASAVQSSESRIRALETSLSHLEKQKQGSVRDTTNTAHPSYPGSFTPNRPSAPDPSQCRPSTMPPGHPLTSASNPIPHHLHSGHAASSIPPYSHPSGPYPSASQARAPASMAATSPVPLHPEQRPNVPCHYEPKEYGGLPTHPLYRVYTSPVQQYASFYP
ncbi:hypothetical protein V5O48_005822 [Marasmius crinis-equi]|uniref:Thiamine pyrophosphate enzyme N-terminal TPP-binding domain-containing protein n=1 Tax=Marasmius crinis-equi TaxID=585013 RepID=A0ABR3FM35_9AGAR